MFVLTLSFARPSTGFPDDLAGHHGLVATTSRRREGCVLTKRERAAPGGDPTQQMEYDEMCVYVCVAVEHGVAMFVSMFRCKRDFFEPRNVGVRCDLLSNRSGVPVVC